MRQYLRETTASAPVADAVFDPVAAALGAGASPGAVASAAVRDRSPMLP
jgi:hypothetical protein